MTNVEHLFMGLFAIFVSSSVKYLFVSFAHFLIRLFFLLMTFESSLFILDISKSFVRYVVAWIFNITSTKEKSSKICQVFLHGQSLT